MDPRSTAAEANRAKTTSVMFGILGLFFLGIVAGPIAIIQANKAERLGIRATAGKILGYISITLSVIQMVVLVFRFLG